MCTWVGAACLLGLRFRRRLALKLLPYLRNNILREQPPSTTHDPLHEIESGDVLQMQDSSSAELLQELNSKLKMSVTWPYPIVLGIVGLIVSSSSNAPGWLAAVVGAFYVSAVFYLYHRDQLRKITVLLYELEPSVEQAYQAVHDAFNGICQLWSRLAREVQEGNVRDRKYHAGANNLVQRKAARPTKGQPPYVKTNVAVPSFPVGNQALYFFPDRLLVFAANGVGALYAYDSLTFGVSQTRFIEEERVPHDSEVVDRTWKYVKQNEGRTADSRTTDSSQSQCMSKCFSGVRADLTSWSNYRRSV